jgi:hypothetical protein
MLGGAPAAPIAVTVVVAVSVAVAEAVAVAVAVIVVVVAVIVVSVVVAAAAHGKTYTLIWRRGARNLPAVAKGCDATENITSSAKRVVVQHMKC